MSGCAFAVSQLCVPARQRRSNELELNASDVAGARDGQKCNRARLAQKGVHRLHSFEWSNRLWRAKAMWLKTKTPVPTGQAGQETSLMPESPLFRP